MRAYFRHHWWVWLLIAVVVVVANEIVDRVGFDEAHPPADIVLAAVVVAVAFFGSYALARRREPARL
jgi:hypothetical protein